MISKLLIAGTNSGVGKTTITMGLIAAWHQQGLRVQPFKAGPDYIDPTYHTLAAGRPCRNIDTWMVSPERALALFNKAGHNSDIAIIEGVMGIFDGFSYETEEGSSAQIAKLVDAPVLLVLDVGKMARSSGAIASGYANFDPELNIAGFILNRCGSEAHYQGVKLAVEQATNRPILGWLPKNANLHIPERHLGLVPTDERGELTTFVNHAANLIEQYFDLDQILTIAKENAKQHTHQDPPLPPINPQPPNSSPKSHHKQIQNPKPVLSKAEVSKIQNRITIAVARDAAFSFYYEDNLDLLRENEASITFFSPLTDNKLPPNISGIYIGGGFPEMYPAQLAANISLKEDLQLAHAANIPIYAECGGFMYLTQAIIDLEGQQHDMVGLVPGLTRMQPRLMSLGYRLVEAPTGNFLLPQGTTTRGHEFHWSKWENPGDSPAWQIQPRKGSDTPKADGYVKGNLVAGYVHLHFAHTLQLARNFVQACQQWQSDNHYSA